MKVRSIISVVVICITVLFAGNLYAETTLYVIPSQHGSDIWKYDVNDIDVDLEFVDDITNGAGGPGVGLAYDSELGLLFLTAEGSDSIKISDANSMTYIGSKVVPGSGNLAGIVADVSKKRLYAVQRSTNHLYVLEYVSGHSYRFLYPDPYYIELNNCGGAFGIALDELTGTLYVADNTTDVKCYSTVNWSHNPARDYVTVSHNAISVAVDSPNKYLYTGSISAYSPPAGSPNLSQYDLGIGTEGTVDVGGTITGLTVDQVTSQIYLATYESNEVLIFDPNRTLIGPATQLVLTAPSGMVVTNGSDGGGIPSGDFGLDIEDGVNDDPNDPENILCISPGDEFTYTVTVDPNSIDLSNVEVTLYLPREVEYEYVDWSTMTEDINYNGVLHSYTWEYDEILMSGGAVVMTLDVKAANHIEPGGAFRAHVVVRSDEAIRSVYEWTEICCWYDGDVIFVDGSASVAGYGTSWAYAYRDLKTALDSIDDSCFTVNEVWVAGGMYSPGGNSGDSFVIPDGVEVYGGFAGDEDPASFDLDTRDIAGNTTILNGNMSGSRNTNVVTMGDETLLDGFSVTNGTTGVYGNNKDITVRNCVIDNNSQNGISNENGDAFVAWCVVKENGYDGILSTGSTASLIVENCKIYSNSEDGIDIYQGLLTVKNTLVCKNGPTANTYGIKLSSPASGSVICNCTIAHNEHEGLYFTGSNAPDIRNCIIWHNNADNGYVQMSYGCSTLFSCVTDPDDPFGGSNDPNVTCNISCDPGFASDHGEYGYYHLGTGSACIDRGDGSLTYTGEVDFDGESRVLGTRVDMGVDEYNPDCSDTSNEYDLNGDGIVNYVDFEKLSAAWLTHDPNDPVCDPGHPDYIGDTNDPNYIDPASFVNWNPVCDLNDDYAVELTDLFILCEDSPQVWLWEACWRSTSGLFAMPMGLGSESMMMIPMSINMTAESTVTESSYAELSDSELTEQARTFIELLVFLAEVYLDENVDVEQVEAIMDDIAEMLLDMQEERCLRDEKD